MRDILTALAAVVAVALAALMVGPYFVDWDAQRQRVAAAIESRTGIETRIGGALRVSLLPTPEFDAGEIEFGPAGAPVARAERLTLSLSPVALLSGRIAFSAARADGALVSRSALREMLAANAVEGVESLAQIGIDQLDLKGVRLVERIDPLPSVSVDAGSPAFDVALEAPSLAGPFRLQVSDPALGRDFKAQIGRLEKGRARLKGVLEDRGLGSRAVLDGWFALPGIAGRPIFDGAATFNGNPVVPGAGVLRGVEGGQAPLQGQVAFLGSARLIVHLDHAIADPINVTLGSGEGAFQLAGQGFADLKGSRPAVQIKLASKRYDAVPHFNPPEPSGAAGAGARGPAASGLAGLAGALDLPFDLALDLAVAAVQVPGGTIREAALVAAVRQGLLRVESASVELPGATRAAFRRDPRGGPLALDGTLEVEAGEVQTLAAWLRGTEGAAALPATARLSLRLAGNAAGVKLSAIRLESQAGSLSGSGELMPALVGRRALPRLTLDLAAERFDARVLAALDPLRPIPGVELASRLAVRRLVLDGQEMGGLQVALDRDGTSATLRQLRLTGRKGEEVTLSGTASGDAIHMTGKLDAERLGDIAELARALLPGAATEAFSRRAGLLEPAIAVGSLRIVSRAGDATWDVALDGKLGGTMLVGRSQSAVRGSELTVNLEGEASNPDGARLAAQIVAMKVPDLAGAGPGPGRITLKAEGNPRRAVTGTLTGVLAGVDMTFEGGLNLFRPAPLEGRFTLAVPDIAVFGRMLGLAGPEPGTGARVRGRLAADRAKVTLGALDARVGPEPIEGEVSFDLARGGQVAGQLRMGTIALAPLLAPALGRGWPQAAAGWAREKFGEPVPPPVSGDLWIEAKQADLGGGMMLAAPQFVLRFAPGAASIEGFEAMAGEARVAGSLSLIRKAETLDLGGRLEFARLPLPLLNGRIAGDVPFSASGASPAELVATLSGAGRVSLDGLVVPAADPEALGRVVRLSLDDLAPINENRIGALVDAELRKGELRIASAAWPLSLINGQLRLGGAQGVAATPNTARAAVAPTFVVDLVRREGEARFSFVQASLPKDWRGAVPEIALVLSGRYDSLAARAPGLQRTLQVSSLVNGFLAMAIQRDLERAEAFEADVREREAQLRRQRGDAFMARRLREISENEAMIAAEAKALRRRALAAAEFERQRELGLRLEREAKEKAEREKAEREKILREAELAARARAEEKAREEQRRRQEEASRPVPNAVPLELSPRAQPPG